VVWVGSSRGSETVLTGLSLAFIAIAVILTASRSGFLCLVISVALFAFSVAHRQVTASRRLVGAVSLMIVLAIGAAWGSADVVLQRFQGQEAGLGVRMAVWRDTLRIIGDFPLVGTGF